MCFKQMTLRASFAIPPAALEDVRVEIFDQLQHEVLRYNDDLGGVPLEFHDVRAASTYGKTFNTNPSVFVDVQLETTVFKLAKGQELIGCVNKVGPDYAGLLIHGLFNATVQAQLQVGDRVAVTVLGFEHANGILQIRATFLRIVS